MHQDLYETKKNNAGGSDMPGICEPAAAYARKTQERIYTIEDIYALPEGVRAELIDGKIYYMAAPSRTHQRINGELFFQVAHYLKSHGSKCEVYIPPFAVFPFDDDKVYLEPDLIVVCDTGKLDEKGCHGAPDWVVEILSPSSRGRDDVIKLNKYYLAGVREYWLIYPEQKNIAVFIFDREREDTGLHLYSFEDVIPCSLAPDLKISLKEPAASADSGAAAE